MRLFLYESLCAGGLGAEAPASLRREGWAMLRAAAEDFTRIPGLHVTALVDDRCAPLPGHICRITHDEERDLFRACAARADATLVIAPEFDDILLQRSGWVLDVGGQLFGSLPEAIALTGDKIALARHWQQRGIRTPATAPAGPSPPTGFGPPWVCKPRRGAGSQATYRVEDGSAWPAVFAEARAAWPSGDLLAQKYVPGTAASVALLVGPRHCVPLMPAAQILSEDGRFQYRGGRVPLPLPLRDRAVRLARSAIAGIGGLQGYVGVDLVLGAAKDGSRDYAIEINPRLTTSYIGLRRLCRDNLMWAWFDILCGNPVKLAWREGMVEFRADEPIGDV